MKPHRTQLLANAVTGGVRSPARGPAVPAQAYAAHTHSGAAAVTPAPAEQADVRVANPRQSSALRERLSQTRARIAQAHAERPPQIDVDWDADEPPTRVYRGEKLSRFRGAHSEPAYSESFAQHEDDQALSALHVEPPADHDAWYADLSQPAPVEEPPAPRARAISREVARQPSYAGLKTPASPNTRPKHAFANRSANHEHATSAAPAFANLSAHSAQAKHTRETAFANARTSHEHATTATPEPAFANLSAHGAQAKHTREPAFANARTSHEHAMTAAPEPSFANLDAHAPRGNHARERSRSMAGPPRAHGARPNRSRVRAEQALTARVPVPVAVQAQPLPAAAPSLPDPELAPFASPLERAKVALTHTASNLRVHLGQLHACIDRSDAALRRRVAYCSLALLVVAAISRMLFATPDKKELETSHASATGQPAATLQNASVSISTDPPGAQIIIDGQDSARATPAKLSDLAPGRHTISLKLAGYAETKEALTLPADALVSIKLASLTEPRFVPEPSEPRASSSSRAEQRAQARELARERRAAARAAKVLLRYRARMGLPPDPVAQELVDAYGPTTSAE